VASVEQKDEGVQKEETSDSKMSLSPDSKTTIKKSENDDIAIIIRRRQKTDPKFAAC
jgi:hypothetical protein